MKKTFILTLILLNIDISKGQTWTQINSPTQLRIKACSFINQDKGWIITDDSIYKTTDGGISWVSQNYPPDPPHNIRFFNSIHFIDANVGIIGCGNYLYTGSSISLLSSILWTNDGGNNWVYKDVGSYDTDFINDAKLTSVTTAYATGQYGNIIKTNDGGATWSDLSQISAYAGNRLFNINSDTLYFASSDDINSQAAFGKIFDNNWSASTVLPNSIQTSFNAIYFFNYLNGWLGGTNGNLYSTINGGQTWMAASSSINSTITDISFLNKIYGWFTTSDGKIVHSSNGGQNWNTEFNGTSSLNALCFTKPNNTGYAVGDSGKILKYLNRLGIQSFDKHFGINIFPNPSTGKIVIKLESVFPNNMKLVIFNSYGETVKEMENISEQNTSLNLENLPKGIYFLRLTDENRIISLNKFVLTGH